MKRILLLTIGVGFLGPWNLAQAQEPVSTDAIYACAEIIDDAQRLACYDDTVGRFEAAEKAGEVTTISKSEVKELSKESFGFSLPSLPRIMMPRSGGDDVAAVDKIEYAVSAIERTRNNKVRVTLENGQVWIQTDGKRVQYSKRLGVKDAVVQRAALGSFKMKLDGGTAFRVKRLE